MTEFKEPSRGRPLFFQSAHRVSCPRAMPSLTPAELATAQTAGRAAAERRYAQIPATAVLKNFELKYLPRLHGARVDGKTLRVPRPVTRKSLYVFLTTCAVATGLSDPAATARRRFQDEGLALPPAAIPTRSARPARRRPMMMGKPSRSTA